jgi:hypothetical protein
MSLRLVLIALLVLVPSVSGGCGDKYAPAFAVEHLPPPAEPPPAEPPAPPVPPPPGFDWSQITWQVLLAGLINSVLVLATVQGIKAFAPWVRAAIPWSIPIIAMLTGPVVAILQNALAGFLGWPIDLSPILAPFTGAAAVAIHQIHRQGHQTGT